MTCLTSLSTSIEVTPSLYPGSLNDNITLFRQIRLFVSSIQCSVPYSCCRNPRDLDSGIINVMCGNSIQNISSVVEVNKFIYTRGCIEAFTEIFERNMNLAACLCLGCALIQLFAMFLARSLQGQIYSQRARWM